MLSCFTSIDKTKGYDMVYNPCLSDIINNLK
jgi:hypothetical protein